ncbi:MAG TPA: hypothetical protein VIM61_00820 [Chthoniobacterales bacterium]|jgi:hypothetical protein
MKKRLLPLTAASLIAIVHPALSQEPAASATPTPLPSPTATPAPSSTPATAGAEVAPAAADSSSKASTASPAEIEAAGKADANTVAESPEVPGDQAPSPVTATTSDSEAAGNVAEPSPSPSASPAAASDADILPEPTDASLGAPLEPPPDAPLPTNDVSPSDLPNPDSLIPSGVSDSDSELTPPAAPTVRENKFDQDRKLQVRYQEVKLQALKDPSIRSLNEQAEKAKTDEMKRQALREYYRLLFAKMTSIDATLKDKCDTMEQAYLRRLGQYRVSPSIPLQPPPTPEPLAN